MLASPIGWVGGKSLLRKQILDRIPDHTCYVELFAGAYCGSLGRSNSNHTWNTGANISYRFCCDTKEL